VGKIKKARNAKHEIEAHRYERIEGRSNDAVRYKLGDDVHCVEV
jgi:phenylacetate-coenzyme A ligase PaaK-like adenylate-forming protein